MIIQRVQNSYCSSPPLDGECNWECRIPSNPLFPARQSQPGNAVKFLQTDFVEIQTQFSPDGRWVAYASDESVTVEVYVRCIADGMAAGLFENLRSNKKCE